MGIRVGEAGWVAHKSARSLLGSSQSEPALEASVPPPGEAGEVVGPDRPHNYRVARPLCLCPGARSPSFMWVQDCPRGRPTAQAGIYPSQSWRLESGCGRGRSLLRPPSWACRRPSPRRILEACPSVRMCADLSSCKDPSPVGLRPTSMTS